ncbi:hypothetical protein M758_9G054000 [Ceratodon purpureus]|nr:hypothetical protein M758_9G054000 [Ceratodon purpureus]
MQRQKRIWRSLLPPSACSYTASIVTETDSLSLSPTHEPANQQTDRQTNKHTHTQTHTHADSLTLRLSLFCRGRTARAAACGNCGFLLWGLFWGVIPGVRTGRNMVSY